MTGAGMQLVSGGSQPVAVSSAFPDEEEERINQGSAEGDREGGG